MKMGGNLFSTTIHVLASAIRKLAPLEPKPMVLYRGIRDLNSFNSRDGVTVVQSGKHTGYLERGFLSSTRSYEVAMRYASAGTSIAE